MEIKSSLLKYKEFNGLKNSLIKVSESDGKDKFRVKMVEYINDTADNNDDMFFYEMLPFSRFLNPSDQAIAYTTPDHLIYLNSPGKVGENVRIWDFIYCHECLHQLWDTFEVGDKIKKAGLEYNHDLLNIASDCVINDYLKSLRKKEPFNDGIFPETIKKEFDIDYDRKTDTQYSLYVKLLSVYEKEKSKFDKLIDALEKLGGDNESNDSNNSNNSSSSSSSGGSSSSSSSGGSSSSSSSGGSSSSSSSGGSGGSDNSNGGDNSESKELSADDAQKAADEAKKNAEDLQKSAKSGGDNAGELQEAADKAKDAAKRAQEAADKAKECADKGDKEGEKKAAEEAKKAAEEAKKAVENANGKPENNSENGNDSSQSSKGGKSNASNNDITDSDEDINEIRKSAKQIIEKYKNKLTGCLGEFLSKCESSTSLKKDGLKANTYKGQAGWNTKMNQICKAFVKKKIFQKKRQYEKTYTRIKRGSGFVKFGQPIDPGRKVKEDKMDINVAFYIDRSGSMGNSIDNVFKAVFYIAEALKKNFGKEKIVNETIFESYAFDYSLHKLKFGQKMSADGGTMSFNTLLDHINKNTKNFLINVIVTDAGFSDIDTSTVKDLLKEIDGIVLFITNVDNDIMKELSKKYPLQLYYILANSQFELD